MKVDEIKPLEAPLAAGDFRQIEPLLQALDKHLVLRTYLDGYVLGELDTKIWLALRGNRAAVSFIKKGSLVNLARWFQWVEEMHPEIQAEVKAKDAAAKAKVAAASKAGASYALALQDTAQGVVTRFLPEVRSPGFQIRQTIADIPISFWLSPYRACSEYCLRTHHSVKRN